MRVADAGGSSAHDDEFKGNVTRYRLVIFLKCEYLTDILMVVVVFDLDRLFRIKEGIF